MIMPVLNGCKVSFPEREDVKNLEFIKVIGMDKQKDRVKLTCISNIAKGGGEGGAPEIEPSLLIAESDTAFNAMRMLHTYSKKKPFIGMAEYFIIGEEGAKYGLGSLTDFVIRDHESRLNTMVFIAKGKSAEKLMKDAVENQLIIGDILESLVKRSGNNSMSKRVYLYELSSMMDSKTLSPYVPCIEIIDGIAQEGTNTESSISLAGLAVFKGDKLLYYLDGNETRAFNFISGDVNSGVINVKDIGGQEVSLEIINATRKIKTHINDEIPSIDLTIRFSSNIDEQWSSEDITREEALEFINSQQSKLIKKEILKVINKAQQKNTDIFGFGYAIHHQHPGKWQYIEDKWEEIFPKIKINVDVKSMIDRTYDIEEPTQHEKKGNKE